MNSKSKVDLSQKIHLYDFLIELMFNEIFAFWNFSRDTVQTNAKLSSFFKEPTSKVACWKAIIHMNDYYITAICPA